MTAFADHLLTLYSFKNKLQSFKNGNSVKFSELK